jgi:hypothetical protein
LFVATEWVSISPLPMWALCQTCSRQLEIPLEDLDHLLSECHTINIQTALVVKLERTHVEVGGSDRHHVSIEDQHIAVKHGGFVFVDLHTTREKRAPCSRRSDAHRFGIVCLSGNLIEAGACRRMPGALQTRWCRSILASIALGAFVWITRNPL